jgi:hypothetical protein
MRVLSTYCAVTVALVASCVNPLFAKNRRSYVPGVIIGAVKCKVSPVIPVDGGGVVSLRNFRRGEL